jgi:hypothetical protein
MFSRHPTDKDILVLLIYLIKTRKKLFDSLLARAPERNFTRRIIVCAVHELDVNFRLFDDR